MLKSSLVWLLCFLPSVAMAFDVVSVSPVSVMPGDRVTLDGTGFSDQVQLQMGTQTVLPERVLPNRMTFRVPEMPAGVYALRIQSGRANQAVRFEMEVMETPLQLRTLSPQNVDVCFDAGETFIQLEGRGFKPETAVLINGLKAPARFISSRQLEMRLQQEWRAGVYGLQLRNPDGTVSLPQSLYVNDIPVIEDIEVNQSFVNYYEITVRGKNYYPNSLLTVFSPDNDLRGMKDRPILVQPTYDERAGFPAKRDRLVYRDCRTLLYQRFPIDFQKEELQLQVINPDGKTSEPFSVFLP